MRSFKLSILASLFFSLSAFAATQITGVVTNGTNGKVAAGDEVTLIRLAQGMQEATHTTTDSKGRFTLDVPDAGMHLVRVTHAKATYFRPAPPGTQSVEIQVFDAEPKVKGVSLEANIVKIQTDEAGSTLRIVENYFIKNESNPPKTQFSERAFEFTLPEGAVVEGSAALAPGGMPVRSAPVPLPEKNHYAFVFPIRPGETRFQVSYRLPYSGKFAYQTSPSMTADTFVVIAAKSMKLDTAGTPLTPVQDEVDAQTYIAHNIPASKTMSFRVSGTGQLPRQTDTPDGQQAGPTGMPAATGAQAAADENRPGGGMANPINTPDPLTKYKWWILAGLAILLAVGAAFMMRAPAAQVTIASAPGTTFVPAIATPSATVQSVLRDELFQLETDRLAGKISEEEYTKLRAAFDLVFKRVMSREVPAPHPPAGGNV